jgi:hypothetical protein
MTPIEELFATLDGKSKKRGEIILSLIVVAVGLAMIGLGAGFGYFVVILGAAMTISSARKPVHQPFISHEMAEVFYADIEPSKHNSGTVVDLTLGLGLGQQSPFLN